MEKKAVSILMPYQVRNGQVAVFLQKRGLEAKVLPGYFSFFGGKVEIGETPEQALVREIKEELNVSLMDYQLLGEYESFKGSSLVLHAYYARVGENFEKEMTVLEGEYGKFFLEKEVGQEPLLIEHDKQMLRDFFKRLDNNII